MIKSDRKVKGGGRYS